MSTAKSPLAVLKAQADVCAKHLKRVVHGINKETIKFGVIMDDKVITIDIARASILACDEASLSEMILREMQERRTDA